MFAALALLGAAPTARAWGCEGHQIIALLAERHLNPRAKLIAFHILTLGPIDAGLPRQCKQQGLDLFADASTWADDERALRPETAAWHFIDIPRGAPESDLARYCRSGNGCIVSALTDQLAVLKDRSAGAQARASALRYVIHLVGDIHQPLHASTNNDRGGNCVPVWFFDRTPRELDRANESYRPNLHEIWDVEILERWAQGRTPQQIANELDRDQPLAIEGGIPQTPEFFAWAWESHELAEAVAYGKLPHRIPVEQPREIASCADDDHVSSRMLRLDELLGQAYQDAGAPVVREQLNKAGVRLAALLNSLWP
jgi:nuclease S1